MPTAFALPRDAPGVVTTLLSTLHGAHLNGQGILCYLTTYDARALRLVNHESREAVSDFRWKDKETRITGSLAAWRACFPRAVWVNLRGRKNITNADLIHLTNIEFLAMDRCGCTKIAIDDFGSPRINFMLKIIILNNISKWDHRAIMFKLLKSYFEEQGDYPKMLLTDCYNHTFFNSSGWSSRI